jgi:hypothetical protein
MLKKLVPFLVAFVLPLLLVYAWWGGFSHVSIGEEVRGPYRYAYLEHSGDYAKLPDTAMQAHKELQRQKIAVGQPISVLYSNPDLVQREQRQARAGFLIEPGVAVAEPLKTDTLPARRVLVAKVRAGQLIAPSRAYSALDRHLQAQGRGIAMPTVEIYEVAESRLSMGEFRVEMAGP